MTFSLAANTEVVLDGQIGIVRGESVWIMRDRSARS